MDMKFFREFNSILPATKARLLMGPAGIGKSALVREIADDLEYEFIDLRLSELEPSDLVGLPYLEKDEETGETITKYGQPWWWPTHGNVVLFLDEMDRTREDMQPIAMQLSLDRRAGGRTLPEGVIIFAACNGEKYMTSSIDQALVSRFAVVELAPSAEEWLKWAGDNGVNDAVVSFIRADKGNLDTPEQLIGVPNQPVPNRRSWSDLGYALNNLEKQLGDADLTSHGYLHLFAAPFIGSTAALAFANWVREKYQVVRPMDIFKGKLKAKNLNIVQISNVVDEVADLFMEEKRTEKQQYNCLKFFMDAGQEAFAALFSALPREAAPKLLKHKDVDEFIRKNADVLTEATMETTETTES